MKHYAHPRTTLLASTLLAAALFVLLSATTSLAQLSVTAGTKTFQINDRISTNQFVWNSAAPVENIRGTSEGVTGKFTFNPADLRTLRGWIRTDPATMKTGNGTRDEHLKSAEWLEVKKYPAITFQIKSVSDVKASGTTASAIATGDFTLHGVTKQLSIPFNFRYLTESAKTRERAPGDLLVISADFAIALKDFNIAGTAGLIGSKVGETIAIHAQLFANSN